WSGGAVDPVGHFNIESFELDGRMPVWRYACGELTIEQRIWMEYGDHTTYCAWRLVPGSLDRQMPVQLHVKLLANARDFHGSAKPWDFNPIIEARGPELSVAHPNWFTLSLRARGGNIVSRHDWFENFDLPVERERGLPDRDSHLSVGEASFQLHPGEWVG